MNNPPPLPQEQPLPLPTLTVAIPKGTRRPIIAVLASVWLADFLFWHQSPGLSIGIFGSFLGILILISRANLPSSTGHWLGFGLLALSCLQSVRFISFSNLLVTVMLLLGLSGYSAHPTLQKFWIRWMEGFLSLVRPLGAMITFRRLTQDKASVSEANRIPIKRLFAIALPAIFLLVIFATLLGTGNAILGKWRADFLTEITNYLNSIEFPKFRRLVWWGITGILTLIFVCPANTGTFSSKLEKPWRQLGTDSGSLRLHQWITCLAALNALFLLSNVTDVIFLWFSRELPSGISHSDYVHHGVYALIATTVLSAMIMALLTQHSDFVSRNRWVQSLSYLWMFQNAVLISGVFLRLWIYVDAYGYTPKRVYVALFLGLVIFGFGLLGWAICKHKGLKWLIGSNLVLVFCFFSTIQFIDVPRWVTHRNIALYQNNVIRYPEALFFRQVGSHSIPYLIAIYLDPQTTIDQQRALMELEEQAYKHGKYAESGWRGYQHRDSQNYQALLKFEK